MESPVTQRNDAIAVREVDGELLVLDRASDQVHQLNRTASMIWRMAHEGAAPQATAAALAAEFDIDEASALADVERTLASLQDLSLLGTTATYC